MLGVGRLPDAVQGNLLLRIWVTAITAICLEYWPTQEQSTIVVMLTVFSSYTHTCVYIYIHIIYIYGSFPK